MRDPRRGWLLAVSLSLPGAVFGATNGIYHPYVNERERELEYGLVWRDFGGDAMTLQSASLAYAWNDRVSTELYVVSERPSHDGGRARAYELELIWQLTEQGEYASDWGLLVEAEVDRDADRREIAAGVLWEKELGHRWVAAANGMIEYEFGDRVDNEFETAFRAQLRYLHAPGLEPTFELYLDDQDYAIGPALQGAWRLGPGKQVRWEWGLLFGIGHSTPAHSIRTGIEFEF